MDVVSELLRAVALKGALFYNAEYTAPWSFRSPPAAMIAPYLGYDARHVILYHLLAEGAAWVRLDSGERVDLGPGDIVIFPHGDPHDMGNGEPCAAVDHGTELQRILTSGLTVSRWGGGGEMTKFVCGYMSCDPQLSRRLLAGLPAVIKVNIRNDPAGIWLENSIRFSVASASSSAAGAEAVLAKLSEVLFVETLRRYLADMPAGQTGWLAGARDPEVGMALGLLHRRPAHPWTIADLAEEVGVSRAVLAERFKHYLGEPPIAYLTRWRLQLGAQLLTATSQGVAEIAAQVGYDSEAAFNRAFKREYTVPPARFRRDSMARRATAS